MTGSGGDTRPAAADGSAAPPGRTEPGRTEPGQTEPGQTEPGRTETVLITGASSGIGRQLARLFAADGARLVLLGRTRAEFGGSAWAHVLHDHLGGQPPEPRLDAELKLAAVLVRACAGGLLCAAQLFTGEEVLVYTVVASLILVAALALSRPGQVPRRAREALPALAVAAAGYLVALALAWCIGLIAVFGWTTARAFRRVTQ